MCTACAALALLTPVGWVRSQAVYTARVGQMLQIGLRPDEPRFAKRGDIRVARQTGGTPRTFVALQGAGNALPPGLSVDRVTGALVGRPSLPGTYTVAVEGSGEASATIRRSFKVRVLPAL